MDSFITKKFRYLFKNIKTIDELIVFDQEKDIKSNISRKFLNFFTELGSSIPILVIIFILYFFQGKLVLWAILPIYLFQLITVEIIKKIFNRSRPKTHKKTSLLGFNTSSGSFPSGHTSNIFCLAFLLTNLYQTNIVITTLLYAIAANIGLSRILLGKHYLVDVFAGAIFGISLAVMGVYIWILLFKNYPELFPNLFF